MQNKKKSTAGLIAFIAGIAGTVFAILTMNRGRSELGYRYRMFDGWDWNPRITTEEILTIAILVIYISLFITGAVLLLTHIKENSLKRNARQTQRIIIECAVMIAVAVVLSIYTKIWRAPLGGSVTLFSMVPLIIIALRHGALWGYAATFVFSASYWLFHGIGQIVGISTYVFVMSTLVDYIVAYTLIGTAGFFKPFVDKSETKRSKIIFTAAATLTACFLRFAAHVAVGAVVWYEITKEWMASDPAHIVHTAGMWVYSIVYNLYYMLPETIITLVAAPAVVTILSAVGKSSRKPADG
jgi:thiamine transporter